MVSFERARRAQTQKVTWSHENPDYAASTELGWERATLTPSSNESITFVAILDHCQVPTRHTQDFLEIHYSTRPVSPGSAAVYNGQERRHVTTDNNRDRPRWNVGAKVIVSPIVPILSSLTPHLSSSCLQAVNFEGVHG